MHIRKVWHLIGALISLTHEDLEALCSACFNAGDKEPDELFFVQRLRTGHIRLLSVGVEGRPASTTVSHTIRVLSCMDTLVYTHTICRDGMILGPYKF